MKQWAWTLETNQGMPTGINVHLMIDLSRSEHDVRQVKTEKKCYLGNLSHKKGKTKSRHEIRSKEQVKSDVLRGFWSGRVTARATNLRRDAGQVTDQVAVVIVRQFGQVNGIREGENRAAIGSTATYKKKTNMKAVHIYTYIIRIM